ncbi:MAG: aspartate kinase [Spirochaetaceae bacterium]
MIVSKFGGSSVADIGQIEKVRKVVESDPQRRVVVVSAPGKRSKEDEKITDLLYSCHREASEGNGYKETFSKIRMRFQEIAEGLGAGGSLDKELEEVERRIAEEKTPDYAASRGEYLNAKLFASYMGAEFIDAEDVVRLTEDGRVDETSYELLAERVGEEGRYVLPGFFGRGPDGKVKTFSRGGSDISGAIAARALEADIYENWTDVSGILMADPRVVSNPPSVREVTYTEVREMASVGANVFHEEAIAPVRDTGIPIHIKNTNEPEAPGTHIVMKRDVGAMPIIGVSGKKPYRKIIIEKFLLARYPDLTAKIKKRIEKIAGKCDFELRGFDTVTFFVEENEPIEEAKLNRELIDKLGADSVVYGPRTAVIGIVGEGLKRRADLVGAAAGTLSSRSIAIEGVNYGGSPVTMLVAVPVGEYETALEILVEVAGR